MQSGTPVLEVTQQQLGTLPTQGEPRLTNICTDCAACLVLTLPLPPCQACLSLPGGQWLRFSNTQFLGTAEMVLECLAESSTGMGSGLSLFLHFPSQSHCQNPPSFNTALLDLAASSCGHFLPSMVGFC